MIGSASRAMRDDLADLVDRAGLEGHVGEAVGAQLLDERQGLVLLGDARGDDDAVDGGAGRARRDTMRGLAELEVPQVAVQEHGVELGGVAGAQLGAQARQVLVVDLLGDLAAAAISAQKPAFAAAATISGSTVVGVMPASSTGALPVSSLNLVRILSLRRACG